MYLHFGLFCAAAAPIRDRRVNLTRRFILLVNPLPFYKPLNQLFPLSLGPPHGPPLLLQPFMGKFLKCYWVMRAGAGRGVGNGPGSNGLRVRVMVGREGGGGQAGGLMVEDRKGQAVYSAQITL